MTATNTTTANPTNPFKTVTKIVTFYSDGTFTEYTPSPMPVTVPYQPYTHPYPWWQGPVSYGFSGQPIECKNNSSMWGSPTEGNVESVFK